MYANQLIHRAKQYSSVEITVKKIDWEKMSLCFHSDAGFANAKDNYTQGGYVVAFCSDDLEKNQSITLDPFHMEVHEASPGCLVNTRSRVPSV